MHECPRCHSACISTLHKLTLGPARSLRCTRCGGKVSVPYGRSIIALLPVIVGTCVVIFVLPSLLPLPNSTDRATLTKVAPAVFVMIIAVALDLFGFVLYLRWVPLIPR
jgi:hypothetical protein